jgi:hypothetical protein
MQFVLGTSESAASFKCSNVSSPTRFIEKNLEGLNVATLYPKLVINTRFEVLTAV